MIPSPTPTTRAARVTSTTPLARWTWNRAVPAADGFFHPSSEEDIVALVHLACERGSTLRVRGAGCSVPRAIHTDARLRGSGPAVDVMLDRFASAHFDDARMEVTVEAGCHLGADPRDPTKMSSWDHSLLAQLERRGWALPDLGGISRQTLVGFLMTGSSGGTVTHAIEDAVVALRWVDGLGVVREALRDRDPSFFAVACSMGLLGVVLTVTLACVPGFDIVGREDITTEATTAYDIYGDGDAGLEGFFGRTEYARLMWWPQRRVERVVTWQARRMREDDYTDETGARGRLRAKPYTVLGEGLPDPRLTRIASDVGQRIGGAFFDVVALGSDMARRLARTAPVLDSSLRTARSLFEVGVLAPVLRRFLPISWARPQRFWAPWHAGLPMDDQMSDEAFPTSFTELFVPLAGAGAVLRALREHFRAGGYDATGPYIIEIYAARASRAWMHPAYGRDSLRVDVFWFERNRRDPQPFFEQFWRLLAPFEYRLHWGKHLPRDPALGSRYLRSRFPQWDAFRSLRSELDPRGVFLTQYWREVLGDES